MSVGNEALYRKSIAKLKEKSDDLGIERYVKPVQITSVKPGEVLYQFSVADVHLNTHGYVHGGIIGVLTDVLTLVAANALVDGDLTAVSVELNLRYMHGMKKGELIHVKAEGVRSGKKMIVCSADFMDGSGKVMARGSHTMYLIKPTKYKGTKVKANSVSKL